MPLPDSKYCEEHSNGEIPVVSSDKVSINSRKRLFDYRKEEASSKDAPGDDFYVIESVFDISKKDGDTQFKIKWIGYPEEESTWEKDDCIPGFIQKYYLDDRTQLKKPLLKPIIKH